MVCRWLYQSYPWSWNVLVAHFTGSLITYKLYRLVADTIAWIILVLKLCRQVLDVLVDLFTKL
jgi:hypothetical protein